MLILAQIVVVQSPEAVAQSPEAVAQSPEVVAQSPEVVEAFLLVGRLPLVVAGGRSCQEHSNRRLSVNQVLHQQSVALVHFALQAAFSGISSAIKSITQKGGQL
jgi:hypothetical protein